MIEQDLTKIGCHGNWRRYKNNPILKDDWGETFDVTVIQVGEKLRMYLSWRSTNSIAFVEGVDGVHWSEPVIVLSPDFTTGWEERTGGIRRRSERYQPSDRTGKRRKISDVVYRHEILRCRRANEQRQILHRICRE